MRRPVTVLVTVVVVAAIGVSVWVWRDHRGSAAVAFPSRVPRRLSCGGGGGLPTFSTATLGRRGLPTSTLFADGPGKALHAFLSGRPGSSFPLTPDGAFIVISRESSRVDYLERLANGFATAAATKERGKWKVRGWADCGPRYQGSVRWDVETVPQPAMTSVPVGYTTGGRCNGPTHEVLTLDHVDVAETADSVSITVYRAQDLPPPGWKPRENEACGSMGIPAHTTVSLKSPLGTRRLFDSGPVPSVEATVSPTAY